MFKTVSFENFNSSALLSSLWEWLRNAVWTEETLFQTIVLLCAFVFGHIFYSVVRKRLTQTIDDSEMPIRVKRTFTNLLRLIFPVMALLVIFVAAQIGQTEAIEAETGLLSIISKLLLAWIIIRISVEFIENSIVRNFFAVSIWVVAALSIFGILPQTMETLDAVGFNVGEFRLSALAVVKGALSIFILLYLALFVSTFLERQVLRSKTLTRSSQVLMAKIIRIALIVIAVFIAVTSAGIDLSVFTVFSGAVGLGLGFGLQKVASNLFSGFLLLMDKSITPGDIIEIQDTGTFGWVHQMAARYTEIVTRENKSYLIPNEDFITQRVINWSHGNRLIRLDVDFGVHYDSNPHQVIDIAKEAATSPERVVSHPAPVCWLTEFGDSSLNFSLRFWIKDAEEGVMNVKGAVLLALWDAFKENNIQIPYPHREIYIHEAKENAS